MDAQVLLSADPRLHVVSLVLYAIGAALAVTGAVLRRERLAELARWSAVGGLVVQGLGLLARWIGSGHGPYVSRYELLSAYAWVSVLIWLVWSARDRRLRDFGLVVLPVALLLIGVGLYTGPEVRVLPATFAGIWLVLHVSFYFIAFATGLTAFGASLFYLVPESKLAGTRLPKRPELDSIAYRAAGLAFAFWGVGLLTGAIWAYYSWGRFWGWDPVETWSLITWLLYGLYLHLRRFYGWKDRRAALLLILCYGLALLSLFGTALFTSTVHSEYFS
ncbi:MAG: cytochrome c biogenesis protein CcsA [Coriobacteriia bacterium]|nr:cytochrome c biogenesis protein CcsA [Coriobacteriia bacterium]